MAQQNVSQGVRISPTPAEKLVSHTGIVLDVMRSDPDITQAEFASAPECAEGARVSNSKHPCKMRNLAGRLFSKRKYFLNKIRHFRAAAMRYDKNPENYLAGAKLTSIRIWLRFRVWTHKMIPSGVGL